MDKKHLALVWVIGLLLALVILYYFGVFVYYGIEVIKELSIPCEDYETCNISDYGYYPGRNADVEEYTYEYVHNFFPEEISDEFQDVEYVFRSRSCELGFEVYLEFTIENIDNFNEHVSTATQGMLFRPFYFDERYQEYIWTAPAKYDKETTIIYDGITLSEREQVRDNTKCYVIEDALIAKILVCPEEHRIVYVVICVKDGAHSDTSFFHAYFDRFSIDAKEYEVYTNRINTH